MKGPGKIIVCATFVFAVSLCFSATLYVDDNAANDPAPGDSAVSDPLEDGTPNHPFDAIQKAINAADPTDTVLVSDGTYTGEGNRDIDFLGKAITVQSQFGPENCIIDCEGTIENPHRAFIFQSGETHNSILSGVSIINGYAPIDEYSGPGEGPRSAEPGGAIYCVNSNAVIQNCLFKNNISKYTDTTVGVSQSSGAGGAICCENSKIIIKNSSFESCETNAFGGAIALWNAVAEISNCVFSGNYTSDTYYTYGGAIGLGGSECSIFNSTFNENHSYSGSSVGTCTYDYATPNVIEIYNSILRGNSNPIEDWNGDSTIIVTYSNIYGGYPGEGNIDENPQFIDPGYWDYGDIDDHEDDVWHSGTDYHLWNQTWIPGGYREWIYIEHNPCVDTGDPSVLYATDDFDGTPRPIDGDGNGQAVSDMGAYEFSPDNIRRIAVNTDYIQLQAREDHKTPSVDGVLVWPPSAELSIHTGDTQPLNWAIVNVSDWLLVGPTSGVSMVDANDVTVTIDIEGLNVGLHTGSFEIIDVDDARKRKTITVDLLIKSAELRVPGNYTTIQEAIDWAFDGETVIVSDGIYTGNGNRDIDFLGKAITVQSQSGPENCIIDCQGTIENPHRAFVFQSGETHNSILSGFKIVNGYPKMEMFQFIEQGIRMNFYFYFAAAVLCRNASPKISNCVLEHCNSDGTGVLACYSASPIIEQVRFCRNKGASILAFSNSSLMIERCSFVRGNGEQTTVGFFIDNGNLASFAGQAGVFLSTGQSIIKNSLFAGNIGSVCGGVAITDSKTRIDNCTFVGNRGQKNASLFGYFIGKPEDIESDEMSSVNDCIFKDNETPDGPEILDGTGLCFSEGMGLYFAQLFEINYSCIEGLSDDLFGLGNIEADPLFVNTGYWDPNGTPDDWNDDTWIEGDYHLKSTSWRWDTAAQKWTWDDVTSPCIDAGNPGMVLGGEPTTLEVDPLNRWGQNIRVNMGAYGGTSEASMAPLGWALLCDLDNSGIVNVNDFSTMAEMWLQTGQNLPPDVSRNGTVTIEDFSLLAQDWLKITTWY